LKDLSQSAFLRFGKDPAEAGTLNAPLRSLRAVFHNNSTARASDRERVADIIARPPTLFDNRLLTRERIRLMDDLTERVLRLFGELGKDSLDLHALFEAGGNDPATREAVVEVVARLVQNGLLEEKGSDFYSLTGKGLEALTGR
jgi:hypothetical protein